MANIQVVNGLRERAERSAAYMELAKYVNLYPGDMEMPTRFQVKNPCPDKFVLTWAAENKVDHHKRNGALVVGKEKGIKTYQMPAEEWNPVKGCFIRYGSVLMESPFEAYMAKIARMTLKSLKSENKDIEHFMRLVKESRQLNEAGTKVVAKQQDPAEFAEKLVEQKRRVSINEAIDANEAKSLRRARRMIAEARNYEIDQKAKKGDLSPTAALYLKHGVTEQDAGVPVVDMGDSDEPGE